MGRGNKILSVVVILLMTFIISGCAVGFYKGRPSDKVKIEELKDELSRLKEAKSLLEKRLRTEIDAKQVKIDMSDRGLVITLVAEVLFDSGKTKIKPQGKEILVKVARILNSEGISNDIGVEGHTDNEPIKHSSWKSNWELSTARATSVLHYFVDDAGFTPERLSATGYGEYKPVASNDTPEGKQKNRRVEIVIKPDEIAKAERKEAEIEAGYIK